MLHRATLVGETTGGATDVGVFHRIDDHFGIGLRESRVTNPYPSPDWAVRGVDPDVRVASDQALETAEGLAVTNLARR
jgi:C-terminal processing protease CtpA/Prc